MRLRVFLHGNDEIPGPAAVIVCRLAIASVPRVELVNNLEDADVAIAPLLTRKLLAAELYAPDLGTLVFHPSLLPRHRGRDAIKWAFHMGEKYSGATWFWADDGYDTGDICEQEVLEIVEGETPRQFYDRAVVSSCGRLLRFSLGNLLDNVIRRRPQREEAATYEPPFPRKAPNG